MLVYKFQPEKSRQQCGSIFHFNAKLLHQMPKIFQLISVRTNFPGFSVLHTELQCIRKVVTLRSAEKSLFKVVPSQMFFFQRGYQ